MRNTFKAYERLKREQHIDTLFRTGKAFSVLQLRFVYLLVPRQAELSPARVGFSVPKKKFRFSVQRHRIRRLMVEAWRVNKNAVYAAIPADKQLQMFILYTGKAEQTYAEVAEGMLKGIERLLVICSDQS